MRIRTTHTYAELEISDSAWGEIAQLLREAGYSHVFSEDGRVIDMNGIGLAARPEQRCDTCGQIEQERQWCACE